MSFSSENLVTLVKLALENQASDIHLRTDEPPALRIRGDLVLVQSRPLKGTDVLDIAKIVIRNKEIQDDLDNVKEHDGGFGIHGLCRVRYNFYRYGQNPGIILRLIKNEVPTLSELGLPSVLKRICSQKRGLALVTGPTGTGKSTTLAAMIRYINDHYPYHIVTIEDPIEYIHNSTKSRISQREIGRDTDNFATGLRSALRQDPDVILIGEMRDPETVQIALKAAETGHMVLSTLHTTDCLSTIGRIISMFPEGQRSDVRKSLATNLIATIGQRMLKQNDSERVVVAQEIMIATSGIKDCILGKEPMERVLKIIQEGHGKSGNGSQTFDQHIMKLYQRNIISKEAALEAVTSQANFLQRLELS